MFVVENPRLSAVRADDQLVLTFEFVNMTIHKASESDPEAYAIPGKDAYLIVHFQPQNIAEKAYFETDPNVTFQSAKTGDTSAAKLAGDPLDPPPVASRMAKPSRLVFKVPADEAPIPLDLETLLQKCSEYELSVAPTALPPEARVYWLDRFGIQKRFDLLATSQMMANLSQPANLLPLESRESRLCRRRISPWKADLPSDELPTVIYPLSPAQKVILNARQQYFAANSSLENQLGTVADTAITAEIAAAFLELYYPRLRAPLSTETSIEAPYRLILSPNKYAAWFHSPQPVRSEDGEVVELWHTRLGTRLQSKLTEQDHYLRTVRAIWTRDWNLGLAAKKDDWGHPPLPNEIPFLMPLDSSDRHNLVHLTANFRIWYKKFSDQKFKNHYTPQPVHVDQMMLSSLGAWLDLHGNWEPPTDNSVDNLGGPGRDRMEAARHAWDATTTCAWFTRATWRPSGTKRCWSRSPSASSIPAQPGNVAYMRQRMFIVVRQPERSLQLSPGCAPPTGSRMTCQMPFTSVRITTVVTPNIDKPSPNSDVARPMIATCSGRG